jgi:hypothetical protein
MVDAEAIRTAAAKLHAKMTQMDDRLFLPTGGAFLSASPILIEEIISGARPITDEAAFAIYAKWHEGVHMAQLVTSPFVFPIAFEMAGLAQRAYRISTGLDQSSNGQIKYLVNKYARLCSTLEDTADEYAPIDVIETHAVTLGVQWTIPRNKSADRRLIANHFYSERSQRYIRLLNNFCDKFGNDIGGILLPKFCFLSLQSERPVRQLLFLMNKLASESSPQDISAYGSIQLCEWAGAPVSLVTQSLRERAASFLLDAEGKPAKLTDHPWVNLFTQYFDEFEAISDHNHRLDILFGLYGGYSHSQFSPRYTIYPGGDLRIRGTDPDDQSEMAYEARLGLIEITLNAMTGLDFLERYRAKHLL